MSKTISVPALSVLLNQPDTIKPNERSKKHSDYMIVPAQYITLLNEFESELSARGRSAKLILRHIAEITKNGMHKLAPNGCEIIIMKDFKKISADSHTIDITIDALKSLKKEDTRKRLKISDSNVKFFALTSTDAEAAMVRVKELEAVPIEYKPFEGRIQLKFDDDLYDYWFGSERGIPRKVMQESYPDVDFVPNLFVEFVGLGSPNRYSSYIGRIMPARESDRKTDQFFLYPLRYYQDAPYYLKPRNAGQAMYLDALMDGNLTYVVATGQAGSGKTLLATCVGLEGSDPSRGFDRQFERIFAVPPDSRPGKDETLPGDLIAKNGGRTKPILDCIVAAMMLKNGPEEIRGQDRKDGTQDNANPKDDAKKPKNNSKNSKGSPQKKDSATADNTEVERNNRPPIRRSDTDSVTQQIRDEYLGVLLRQGIVKPQLAEQAAEIALNQLTIYPLSLMRGSTINRCLFLLDESQNNSILDMKLLIERVGFGTKLVICGDPAQIDNPHMSKNFNALTWVQDPIMRSGYGAVIHFYPSECERSPVTAIMSEILNEMGY